MKRSFVNRTIKDNIQFVREHGFHLPPFAYYTFDEWKEKGMDYAEIYDNLLGWDVTDFGSGNFEEIGLVAFTIRNGNAKLSDRYPKPYAEKVLIAKENQKTPMHFHHRKMEDIIVRGGGNLLMRLYNAAPDDTLEDTPVNVSMDGRLLTLRPGEILRLTPGESVCLAPRMYHDFWAEPGYGKVLLGEVSLVNDDSADNRFLETRERFVELDEDEPVFYPLAVDVANWYSKTGS